MNEWEKILSDEKAEEMIMRIDLSSKDKAVKSIMLLYNVDWIMAHRYYKYLIKYSREQLYEKGKKLRKIIKSIGLIAIGGYALGKLLAGDKDE